MIPIVLSGAVTALAAAGVVMLTDTPQPASTPSVTVTRTRPSVGIPSQPLPDTLLPVQHISITDAGGTTTMVSVTTEVADNGSFAYDGLSNQDGIMMIAVNADGELLNDLAIDASNLNYLSTALYGADSVVMCSGGSTPVVTVCSYKNGAPQPVQIGSPSSMPVMFTSADGKGHVIRTMASATFNPNELIPVAAGEGNAKMLMWFKPEDTFVQAFPDSIRAEMESLLQGLNVTVQLPEMPDMPDMHVMMDSLKTQLGACSVNPSTMMFDVNKMLDSMKIDMDGMKINMDGMRMMMADSMNADSPEWKMLEDSLRINLEKMKLQMSDSTNIDPSKWKMDGPVRIQMNGMGMNMQIDTLGNGGHKIMKYQIAVNGNDVANQMAEVSIGPDGANGGNKKVNIRRNVVISKRISTTTTDLNGPCNPAKARSWTIVIGGSGCNVKTPAVTETVIPPTTGLQETWRSAAGAVTETNVYPNPTSDGGATMSYSLSKPRVLSLALHDLSGTKLVDLVSNVSRDAGNGQLAFTLGNMSAGMYLLSMTTDKGERVVQRLIVNN